MEIFASASVAVVLRASGGGAMRLSILEAKVDRWVEAEPGQATHP